MSAKIAICARELLLLISNIPEKGNVCGCEFSDYILVLWGDWMWIAAVLGYTGPKGVHFVRTVCAHCLLFKRV